MSWRVALIDSCGDWPRAAGAAAFADRDGQVAQCATVADTTGHGSRVAQLLAGEDAAIELLLGQVFLDARPASAAAVAAAVDWAVAAGADLIHMSLGLAADRAVLAAAVARATGSGCIVVASAPARGAAVFPAAYSQVIRGTGDARCEPGELSHLGEWYFGGCPRFEADAPAPGVGAEGGAGIGAAGGVSIGAAGGASVGAAWVTRSILGSPKRAAVDVVAALTEMAHYVGPERRGRASG